MQQTGADPLTKGKAIVEAALERKAERPVVLAMRELTSYADAFVILTGRSDRQVRAIAQSIVEMLKSQGDPPLGVEGLDDGNWVLIDCNDTIVHVFDPETRTQYDLERLWRDAPRMDLGIEGVDPDPDVLLAAGTESGAGASGSGPASGASGRGGVGSSAA